MKRLIHENRVPYGGGYDIKRPDLGMVGYGNTFESLLARVTSYRRANGIPIGLGFRDELEALVCEQYPDECRETDPRVPPKPRRLTLGEVMTGTRVMMTFLAEGRPIVSPDEAARRADICAVCTQNVEFAKPCGSPCGELKALVARVVGHQQTPRASELRSCNICGCYLESAVWMDLEIQLRPLAENVREQFTKVPNCWKKL